jgi:UDP-glucose 4-epimerase
MKRLVTGGAGFVGSRLSARLLGLGHQVTAYDDLSVGRRENVPEGAAFIEGDILDMGRLRDAMRSMRGVDVVFHNAAFVSIRNSFFEPRREAEVNVTGTLNVLDAIVEAGEAGVPPKIVFASSMAVYGIPQKDRVHEGDVVQPISPYGLSKLKGEMLCRVYSERFGVSYSALRYFNIFGEGQAYSEYVGVLTAFISLAKGGRPITVCGDGTQERDFVYVGDVAEANVLAMGNTKNAVYNIGSGTRTSILSVAQAVRAEYGNAEIAYVPRPPGEIQTICADIGAAKSDLGFAPRFGILEYISKRRADLARKDG